jgi:hypothetical protein
MSGFKDGRQVIVPVHLEFTSSLGLNIYNSSTHSHPSEEEIPQLKSQQKLHV